MLGLTTKTTTTTKTSPTTVCGVPVGTLESVRSVTGYDLGLITSPDRRQVTVQFDLPDVAVCDETTWQRFEQFIASIPQIIAAFTVDTAGTSAPGARVGVVFRTVHADEVKDHASFLADIAVAAAAPLFAAADATLPVESRPLTPADVCEHLTSCLRTTVTTDWSAVTSVTHQEHDDHLVVGDTEWSVFQTPVDADVLVGEVDELMGLWEGTDWLRRTRIFRPHIVADAADDTTLAGDGRRHQIITVTGGLDADAAFINSLSSKASISLRRAWLRQAVLAVEGLGTGVLGFQNPLSTLHRPRRLRAGRY